MLLPILSPITTAKVVENTTRTIRKQVIAYLLQMKLASTHMWRSKIEITLGAVSREIIKLNRKIRFL